jgi:transketolase N-terminal domain/subunit
VGRLGNSGVGILKGPGEVAVSLGLAKVFSIRERARLRLEASFTNLPNHPNFAPPGVDITTPSFGQTLTVTKAENGGNRTGQLAMRIDF